MVARLWLAIPNYRYQMKKQLVKISRRLLLSTNARLGVPRLYQKRGEANVTALLFHRFFEDGESRHTAIDRLRRELDWLRTVCTPISLPQFIAGLGSASLPDRAVLVTTDDALHDILGVADEFKSFEIPFCAFVCAGWTATASSGAGEDLVARAASAVQWYEGDDIEIRCGSRSIELSARTKARNIDALIIERESLLPYLEELCTRLERPVKRTRGCCTWEELRHLASVGVGIGAHSVTHVNLSQASAIRRKFEIAESRRLCEALVGRCEAFAYPYGVANSHSEDTRNELKHAGFSTAFLSHSDFITVHSDTMTLPRISMPDEPMTLPEFRALAKGGGILIRSLKGRLYGRSASRH